MKSQRTPPAGLDCELVSTGDELVTGAIADTNAAMASRILRSHGLRVSRVTVIGDDRVIVPRVLRESCDRVSVVIVSGGLGPTEDDITAECAADFVGRPLELDETALGMVEAAFRRMNRPMSPNNRRQAMLPRGCEVLPNPEGTAPGFMVKSGEANVFFLPGVPREYRRMLEEQVLPRVASGNRFQLRTRVLRLFGQGESRLAQEVAEIELPEGAALGWRASFPEVQLRIYASGEDDATVSETLRSAESLLRERVDRWIFGVDDETMPGVVGRLLRERGWKLAVAESCTGGWLGKIVTDVPGSSAWFDRGYIVYSNEAKTAELGVPAELIERHGAVSDEVARAMASGALVSSGGDLALSLTGVAGPDAGTAEKPVGTVFVGMATRDEVRSKRLRLWTQRDRNREASAYFALDLARRLLSGIPDPGR